MPTTFHKPLNFVSTTAATARSSGNTTLVVADGSLFGSTFPILVVAARSGTPLTILEITARSGNTLTVTGGLEGTSDSALAVGDVIEPRPTGLAVTELQDAFHVLEALVATTVYTTVSYSNPSWITALAGSKITGNIAGNAGTVTNGVVTTGSYADPAWITALAGSKITGNIAGNAGTVTNGVVTTGSYSNPSWITGLDGSKISGTLNSIIISSHGGSRLSTNSGPFNLAAADWHIRLLDGSNGTLSLAGELAFQQFTVELYQDGTGGRAVTWWDGILWSSGSPPTLITAAGCLNWCTFKKTGSGSYLGWYLGSSSPAAPDASLVHTTGDETVAGVKTFSSTIIGSVSGNAATATNGVVTTGSYSDPAWITSLAASKVGLGSVENTAISTWSGSTNLVTLGTVTAGTWHGTPIADAYIASASAWNAKAPLASPALTGTPTAPTAANGTNTTQIATTAFVLANVGGGAVSSVFTRTGAIVATSGDYSVSQITGAAPLASPTFTGTPAAPTATVGTNTTQVATCAFVLANAGGGSGVTPNSLCQGRLTLTSGLPVTTADVTAAGTVYWCPYKGNQIGLYNGTSWDVIAFTQQSISLASGFTTGKNYDVFAYNNSGTIAIETLVWTDDTTRATALALQDGIYCKTGALTRRYLGTFRTVTSTTTEDSVLKRYVYNYNNRIARALYYKDPSGATVGNLSFTWTLWASDPTLHQDFVMGVVEDAVSLTIRGEFNPTVDYGFIGVGLNWVSGVADTYLVGNQIYIGGSATVSVLPVVGLNLIYTLVNNDGSTHYANYTVSASPNL